MLNKEKRNVILSSVLGDGCINHSNNYNSSTGYLMIKHSIKQKDWLEYKHNLVSLALNRKIEIHDCVSYVKKLNKSYDQVKFSVGMKRFRSWHKIFYPNRKKDLVKILKFINDPIQAITLWFGDDGSVANRRVVSRDPSFGLTAGGLMLYCCDQSEENAKKIIEWFKDKFNVEGKLYFSKVKWNNEYRIYPNIKFNYINACVLWKLMRTELLKIPSMQYKFRLFEERYQKDLLTASNK